MTNSTNPNFSPNLTSSLPTSSETTGWAHWTNRLTSCALVWPPWARMCRRNARTHDKPTTSEEESAWLSQRRAWSSVISSLYIHKPAWLSQVARRRGGARAARAALPVPPSPRKKNRATSRIGVPFSSHNHHDRTERHDYRPRRDRLESLHRPDHLHRHPRPLRRRSARCARRHYSLDQRRTMTHPTNEEMTPLSKHELLLPLGCPVCALV